MSGNILVLDVGTSSMRGVLYDEDGKSLFSHRVKYTVQSSGQVVEQSPKDWAAALVEICSETADTGYPVDGLSLTSQRSSVIPVDCDGVPLRNAIMWQDTRNAGIVEEMAPCAKRISTLTGARLNTVFSGTKMTWFRRNEPALYAKTYKLCTIADYLTFLITGQFVTDETYGSRSLLMNLQSKAWERELLDLFEVERGKLCRLIEPGGISGRTTAAFARETGLRTGIPLVSAGGDQQCGALGQGLFEDGTLAVTFGTSACLLKYTKTIPDHLNGLICGAHSIPQSFVLEGSMLTCGAMLDWVHRTFFEGLDYAALDKMVQSSPPGANGLVMLPNFQGRGTPDWESSARGALLFLDLGSTRADMARVAIESIVYEVVNNIEIFDALSGNSNTIHIGGGVARSSQLCKILADASGKTVIYGGDGAENTAFGAWISAAVTLGLRTDYADAFKSATFAPKRIEPDSRNFEAYWQGRKRMNDAYMRLYGNCI